MGKILLKKGKSAKITSAVRHKLFHGPFPLKANISPYTAQADKINYNYISSNYSVNKCRRTKK